MRVLGIDYGEKRIGLALSDELPLLARELVILSPKEFWKQIEGLVSLHEVGEVVVGWPLNMSGEMTAKTREVAEFKAKLAQKLSVPVVHTDERLSSQMAEHLPGGYKNVDSLAAQILLQNYLDKKRV
jgi:putative Holliday junction resolvase